MVSRNGPAVHSADPSWKKAQGQRGKWPIAPDSGYMDAEEKESQKLVFGKSFQSSLISHWCLDKMEVLSWQEYIVRFSIYKCNSTVLFPPIF